MVVMVTGHVLEQLWMRNYGKPTLPGEKNGENRCAWWNRSMRAVMFFPQNMVF